MVEFRRRYGEKEDVNKEYDAVLKLFGAHGKPELEKQINCVDTDGDSSSKVINDEKKDDIDNNRGEWNKRAEKDKEKKQQ